MLFVPMRVNGPFYTRHRLFGPHFKETVSPCKMYKYSMCCRALEVQELVRCDDELARRTGAGNGCPSAAARMAAKVASSAVGQKA